MLLGRCGYAQSQDASIRRNAIDVRLARKCAFAVLHVAMVRTARNVVLTLESDRTGHRHLTRCAGSRDRSRDGWNRRDGRLRGRRRRGRNLLGVRRGRCGLWVLPVGGRRGRISLVRAVRGGGGSRRGLLRIVLPSAGAQGGQERQKAQCAAGQAYSHARSITSASSNVNVTGKRRARLAMAPECAPLSGSPSSAPSRHVLSASRLRRTHRLRSPSPICRPLGPRRIPRRPRRRIPLRPTTLGRPRPPGPPRRPIPDSCPKRAPCRKRRVELSTREPVPCGTRSFETTPASGCPFSSPSRRTSRSRMSAIPLPIGGSASWPRTGGTFMRCTFVSATTPAAPSGSPSTCRNPGLAGSSPVRNGIRLAIIACSDPHFDIRSTGSSERTLSNRLSPGAANGTWCISAACGDVNAIALVSRA
jgi:uncharacterized Zn-binding protein involved in type VI secretion